MESVQEPKNYRITYSRKHLTGSHAGEIEQMSFVTFCTQVQMTEKLSKLNSYTKLNPGKDTILKFEYWNYNVTCEEQIGTYADWLDGVRAERIR